MPVSVNGIKVNVANYQQAVADNADAATRAYVSEQARFE